MPLAAAIAALRQELLQAWTDASDKRLQFKVAPVELTVEAQVTWSGEAGGGIKWWLIDANAKVSREHSATQTIKLTLDPVMFDANGDPVSILIDAPDVAATGTSGSGRSDSAQLLDATDD